MSCIFNGAFDRTPLCVAASNSLAASNSAAASNSPSTIYTLCLSHIHDICTSWATFVNSRCIDTRLSVSNLRNARTPTHPPLCTRTHTLSHTFLAGLDLSTEDVSIPGSLAVSSALVDGGSPSLKLRYAISIRSLFTYSRTLFTRIGSLLTADTLLACLRNDEEGTLLGRRSARYVVHTNTHTHTQRKRERKRDAVQGT